MQRPMGDLSQLLYNISNPKPGRRGNPRMNRAVELRLEKPEMTLLEALCAAGFVFSSPTQAAGGDEEIFDADGVPLSKRKNQLSKRLWQAKQRLPAGCTNKMIKEEEVTKVEQVGFLSPLIKSNHQVSCNQSRERDTAPVYQNDFNLKFGNNIEKTNVYCDQNIVFPDKLHSNHDAQRAVSTKGIVPQEFKCSFEQMFTEDKVKTSNPRKGIKRPLDDDENDNESFIDMIDSCFEDGALSFGEKQPSGDLCRERKIQKKDQDFLNIKNYQYDDTKMQKALGFYQDELGSIIEESMVEAGFTSDETKPNSLQYVKFVEQAAKSTFEKIEEIRKLVNCRTFQEMQC